MCLLSFRVLKAHVVFLDKQDLKVQEDLLDPVVNKENKETLAQP